MQQKAPAPGSLAEILAATLRADIETGGYQPGAPFPSADRLARTYGATPEAARTAISFLMHEGRIEPHPAGGLTVRGRTDAARPRGVFAEPVRRGEPLIQVMELRMAVECEAARLAALRRSPEQARTIAMRCEALRVLSAENDTSAKADFAFHFAIAQASNNPRFCDFLQSLGPAAIANREGARKDVSPDALVEHEEIKTAILSGNCELARVAMRSHLEASLARYRASLTRNAMKTGAGKVKPY